MKIYVSIILILQFFFACSKNSIDVEQIYPTDQLGNVIGNTPNDNQWKQQSLSDKEMDLFNSLDTANLGGTMQPTIAQQYYAYPNPFVNYISLSASLSQPLNADIVVKYVIVNKDFNAVAKKAFRLSVANSISFLIPGDFGSGNYRLYFTYSAAGNEHFFKSWGNIKKQ